jgi:hypothetical protein
MHMGWHVQPDGTFDLCTPAATFAHCWPALDGVPLHPLRVEAGENSVAYSFAAGALRLEMGRSADGFVLRSVLHTAGRAPRWVEPCAGAHVTRATRFFRHGLGFSGPSGFVDLLGHDEAWACQSYLTCALDALDGPAVAVCSHDHRRFLQKCTLHNRQDRSGLTDRQVDQESLLFGAGFRTERIEVAGGELALPDLHFHVADTCWGACSAAAQAIAREMAARGPSPPRYHWCSWYYREDRFSEHDLVEYLDGFARLTPRVPLQAIQLDDGYFPARGDWLMPNRRWPHGVEPAFDRVRRAGYCAGAWVAPFMVSRRSNLCAEHPDWVLRDGQGRMTLGPLSTDDFVLDTSHPAAMDYLRTVFCTLRGQGVTFFKTDFMDWGLHDSTLVQRHTPGKTSVEHFRDVLAMIRESIGDESYWLACISPYAPFIGFADGMRLANDTTTRWTPTNTLNMIDESVACHYFNNVFWQNDTDAIILRQFENDLTDTEVTSLALWQGMLGTSVNTSDPLHRLSPERLRLLRFIRPADAPWSAGFPYWGSDRKLRVAVRQYGSLHSWAVLALNPTDGTVAERMDLADLVGRGSAACFTWRPEGAVSIGTVDHLEPALGPHESRLFYVAEDGRPPPLDLTLGGARAPAEAAGQ